MVDFWIERLKNSLNMKFYKEREREKKRRKNDRESPQFHDRWKR